MQQLKRMRNINSIFPRVIDISHQFRYSHINNNNYIQPIKKTSNTQVVNQNTQEGERLPKLCFPFNNSIQPSKVYDKQDPSINIHTSSIDIREKIITFKKKRNQSTYSQEKKQVIIAGHSDLEKAVEKGRNNQRKKRKNTQSKGRQPMKFSVGDSYLDSKSQKYKLFIYKINYTNSIFINLDVIEKDYDKLKVYIGKGNNSLFIRGLFKKRIWWQFTDDIDKANLIWTQLKSQQTHLKQPNNPQSKSQNQNFKQQLYKLISFNELSKAYKKEQYIQKLQNSKIFNEKKYKEYKKLCQEKDQDKVIMVREVRGQDLVVHNHLENNYHLGNKKALFYNLKQLFDLQKRNVFSIVPLTFHLTNGDADDSYNEFLSIFKEKQKNKKRRNIWIVKPGQSTNRGNGITVIRRLSQLNSIIKQKIKQKDGNLRTFIVQEYIQRPFLYKFRKFDIRHYMVISNINGKFKSYWFKEGYIRTSSYQYNLDSLDDIYVHLTNDAIQCQCQEYSKFQEGNKLSYSEFQRYLDLHYPERKYNFREQVVHKMKEIARDSIRATFLKLDPNNKQHNFQIYGLDFMIDQNFKVWLIEVNTNPCLQMNCAVLNRIIPTLIENTLRLCVDPIFPPRISIPYSMRHLIPDRILSNLKYQLIFDQQTQCDQLKKLFQNVQQIQMGQITQDQIVYSNQGKQLQQYI